MHWEEFLQSPNFSQIRHLSQLYCHYLPIVQKTRCAHCEQNIQYKIFAYKKLPSPVCKSFSIQTSSNINSCFKKSSLWSPSPINIYTRYSRTRRLVCWSFIFISLFGAFSGTLPGTHYLVLHFNIVLKAIFELGSSLEINDSEIMIFSIACLLFAVNAADQHETEQFKVIPGGEEHTHTGSMVRFWLHML